MKTITQTLFFIAIAFSGFSQDFVYIDFGIDSQETPGNWNNISIANAASTDGLTAALIDSNGMSTGVTLTIDDQFNTVNNGGSQSPDASLPFPETASRDSFFGSSTLFQGLTEPEGGFILTGLDPSKYYSFIIFASRNNVSDNRETLYTVTGSSTFTETLNPSNNTLDTADIFDVQSNATGEITFRAEAGANNTSGPQWYYLGAIEMTISDTPLSINNFNFDNSLSVSPNPVKDVCDIKFNLKNSASLNVGIYDINGRLISTVMNGESPAGQVDLSWDSASVKTIASGLYILKIKANDKVSTSKLVIK